MKEEAREKERGSVETEGGEQRYSAHASRESGLEGVRKRQRRRSGERRQYGRSRSRRQDANRRSGGINDHGDGTHHRRDKDRRG